MDPPEVAGLEAASWHLPGNAGSRETAAARKGAPHLKRSLHLGPLGAAELCVLRAAHRGEPAKNHGHTAPQHHYPETGLATLRSSGVHGST